MPSQEGGDCERNLKAPDNQQGIPDQDGWDAILWQNRLQYRRPLFDSVKALIKWKPNMTILDLGCGTGDFTCEVHRQAGVVTTLGVDNSMNMLAVARSHQMAGLSFECHSIDQFEPAQKFDLIMSVNALQWVPDHHKLFGRFYEWLNGDGQLVFQLPLNQTNPFFEIYAELIRTPPYSTFLQRVNGNARGVLPTKQYELLLEEIGFTQHSVQFQVHDLYLDSWTEVLDFVHATQFVHARTILPAALYKTFEEEYDRRFWNYINDNNELTRQPFFAAKRINIWAQRL